MEWKKGFAFVFMENCVTAPRKIAEGWLRNVHRPWTAVNDDKERPECPETTNTRRVLNLVWGDTFAADNISLWWGDIIFTFDSSTSTISAFVATKFYCHNVFPHLKLWRLLVLNNWFRFFLSIYLNCILPFSLRRLTWLT